jgi:phosphotransferase system enzyme I (PtsI)/phosphotransferase system enzyme I (PtsP)
MQSLTLIDDTLSELLQAGYPVTRPRIGIMLEVPSCISLLPFWLDKVDFVSIGTNDLSQYLLAIDRNNPYVSKWFDALHPAILHELYRISRMVLDTNLPVSICGELASSPVAVVLLLGMGFKQFSMSAAKIPLIKHLICEISTTQAQTLTAQALSLACADEIHELGRAFLARSWSHYQHVIQH